MSDSVYRAARAICSKSLNGFCWQMGEKLGCENGRGASGWHLCKASEFQLVASGHYEQAEYALKAAQTPAQRDLAD